MEKFAELLSAIYHNTDIDEFDKQLLARAKIMAYESCNDIAISIISSEHKYINEISVFDIIKNMLVTGCLSSQEFVLNEFFKQTVYFKNSNISRGAFTLNICSEGYLSVRMLKS